MFGYCVVEEFLFSAKCFAADGACDLLFEMDLSYVTLDLGHITVTDRANGSVASSYSSLKHV